MAAPPAGTGLLANPWNMEGAGGWVAPSEEPVVLEPVAPEPGMPEPACPERFSCVQPSQREVGTMGIQVVLQAERPPEEACSKWSNLEG